MIIPAYKECPVCVRNSRVNSWVQINHNQGWWEEMCSNYHGYCYFAQFRETSFEDENLEYIRWALKDFFCYTYAIPKGTLIAGTYFYHTKFPRVDSVQSPYQVWPDFMPDWDNLDKINQKLKKFRVFQ